MTGNSGGAAGGDARQHLRSVARGGVVSLGGAAVSAVSGFLLALVVTNAFTSDSAGTFFAATSVLLVLVAVASLGTETSLARFMLRFEALGRVGDLRPVVRLAFRSSLSFAVVLGVVLFASAERVAHWIGVEGDEGATILRVLAASLPFLALNNLALAGTRAFGQMGQTAAVDSIGRAAAQPALATLIGVIGAGSVALTASWVVPYVIASLISGAMFVRLLRQRGVLTAGQPTTPYPDIRREFWSFTWPRSISRISQMAIQRVDIVLVAAMLSPRDAAIYTAATRFVPLGQAAAQAINQVLQPKFTQLLTHQEDGAVLGDVYRTATAWAMAVTWPLYVFVGCAPGIYLSIFGSEYNDGTTVVMVMAASMMLAVASGAADTLLLMSGRSRISLANSLIALTIDVVLCVVLLPVMGIAGAAVAWAAAVLTKCTLAFVATRRYLEVVSFGSGAAVVAAASLVCLALPVGVLVVVDAPVWLLLVFPLGLIAYAGALWLGRRQLMLGVFRDMVATRRSGSRRTPV